MKEFKVGRCRILFELAHKDKFGGLNKYDVIVCEGDIVLVQWLGCTQFTEEDTIEAYLPNATEKAERYSILRDALDMAEYNFMCYSKDVFMEEPKMGCRDRWNAEKRKIEVLRKWIEEALDPKSFNAII